MTCVKHSINMTIFKYFDSQQQFVGPHYSLAVSVESCFTMGRKQNEKVWSQFKNLEKGVECLHCKKKYAVANVNKMENHLLSCLQCPDEVRKCIQNKSQSTTNEFGENSNSSFDSVQDTSSSSQGSALSAISTPKSTPKRTQLMGFVDKITVAENVSKIFIIFELLFFL